MRLTIYTKSIEAAIYFGIDRFVFIEIVFILKLINSYLNSDTQLYDNRY